MNLRYYLRLVRRWWWLLLLGFVIPIAPAYALVRTFPPTYRATATVFVDYSAATDALTYDNALLSQQLTKTYSQMAAQPVVLTEVQQQLHLSLTASQLAGMIQVRPITNTQLFQIAATGEKPKLTRDIANTTARVFISQQSAYLPAGQASKALRIAQPALMPVIPIGPHPLRDAALAGFVGFLIAIGIMKVYEYFDDTVKTPEDLEDAASLATLGAVLRVRGKRGKQPLSSVLTHSHTPLSESYRLVRTNLEFAGLDQPIKSLLITSASPLEGKSTTAANLAVVTAEAGVRVILVDGDLRKPSLHRTFDVLNQRGLSTLLLREGLSVEDCLQSTSAPGLRVLTSGPLPSNPAELLASQRMRELVDELIAHADLVIFDSPPTLAVADPIVLASRVDATVVVVDSSRTRAEAVRHTTESLAKSGTRLLGAVLNKLSKNAQGYYYYDAYRYRANRGDGTSG